MFLATSLDRGILSIPGRPCIHCVTAPSSSWMNIGIPKVCPHPSQLHEAAGHHDHRAPSLAPTCPRRLIIDRRAADASGMSHVEQTRVPITIIHFSFHLIFENDRMLCPKNAFTCIERRETADWPAGSGRSWIVADRANSRLHFMDLFQCFSPNDCGKLRCRQRSEWSS